MLLRSQGFSLSKPIAFSKGKALGTRLPYSGTVQAKPTGYGLTCLQFKCSRKGFNCIYRVAGCPRERVKFYDFAVFFHDV